MAGSNRIAVFTGDLAYSVRKGIVEIDESIEGLRWLVVVHAPRKSLAQLVRNQWRNLRRNGWRWITYQATDLLQRARARSITGVGTAAGLAYTTEMLKRRPNVQIVQVADVHAQPSLAMVQEFAPDLALSLAAPILRESLFSIPRLGTVNLHKGRVPDYRGMPPAFWELWNGESAVGCTVHRVDAKLDTGDVIRRAEVERAPHSTLRGLQLQLDETGISLMRDAVRDLLLGRAKPTPQTGAGKTYRKPTLKQFAVLERRLAAGLPSQGPVHERAAKTARSILVHAAWRVGLGRVLAPRITVLLYHRVSDDVRDNLTVGIAQFDRQMQLLRRHCEVLSIEQVITSATVPESNRPLVAVTFDDGYRDNFDHAAPILLRHAVPGAFFVSTGIVGTDGGRFPHDLRRGNPPIPVLSWDQLRQMRDRGFTIGSHSVSHIDCAAEPEAMVSTELAESRDALRRELGVTEPLFGYPYGGRQHMTPQRLELVRQAGYQGCLSAYGGSNVLHVDRYNVLRRGIHWQFSDRAFLYECLGL
jgi:peptidoglycan/xylan/chitin deacetylase (PgdA/CDA1 family)